MPDQTVDDLDRILERHREMAAAARAEAAQLARGYADARHDCADRLRGVALPLMRDWSKRLSVEGYPTHIEDRIGCHPPSLIFRLAPHGGPESSLALQCEIGRIIHFRMTVGGRDAGGRRRNTPGEPAGPGRGRRPQPVRDQCPGGDPGTGQLRAATLRLSGWRVSR